MTAVKKYPNKNINLGKLFPVFYKSPFAGSLIHRMSPWASFSFIDEVVPALKESYSERFSIQMSTQMISLRGIDVI